MSVLGIRINFTYNWLQPLNTTKCTYTILLWPCIATKAALDMLKKEENSWSRYVREEMMYTEVSLRLKIFSYVFLMSFS